MGPGKLVGGKKEKKSSKSKCGVKCDGNVCPKNDLKKPSKRNVKDPELRKTNFVTGNSFPSCDPLDKDTFFYHTKKNMIFTFNRKKKEWQPAHCGSITVETANTETGPSTSGPFTLDTCGDTLRLWSAGGLFANVTPGSALVQVEPNIIHCGNDPENFMPADPTRPALYFNSNTGNFFVWDPENEEGSYSHWHTTSGGTGTNIDCKIGPGGENDSLVIDKGIMTNVQGIVRLYLDENVFLLEFHDENATLDPSEMSLSFNTISDDYVLTESGLFTVPPVSFFNNSCLNEGSWRYILEVNIKLNFRLGFFNPDDDDDYLIIQLIKNEGNVISQVLIGPTKEDFFEEIHDTVTLTDTILLSAGDVLNVYIYKNDESSDGKIELLGGSENSVLNFKILGMIPTIG